MPYLIKLIEKDKYKVCKKKDPNMCFSKFGLTLEKAKKQLKAIGMNENENKGSAKPKNEELYKKIKEDIYKSQPHSLFRSARIQKEYKKQNGEYEDTEEEKNKMNLKMWFNQNWISLNSFLRDKIVKCGSDETEKKYNEYPLCRPLEIAKQLKKEEIKEMIKEKNILKEKPLITEKIIKTKKLNIKPTNTGLGKPKKLKQIPKKLFLNIVKKVAKSRGYEPNNLKLSNDNIHKLEYYDGKKWLKFGRKNYFDFPTYLYNYILKNITKEEAIKKMENYRKRATNIKGNWKNNKYSKNNLAINLLW